MSFYKGQRVMVRGSDRFADGAVVEICALTAGGKSVLVRAHGAADTVWIGVKCLNEIPDRMQGIIDAATMTQHAEPHKTTQMKVNDAPWRLA